MSEQADILDFNEVHRNRNSNVGVQERFSIKKIKEKLNLQDVDRWVQEIKLPNSRNYTYPSSLEKAIEHQQSCYIQPDKDFLEKCKINNCDCCGQMIRRKKYNIFTCNMHDIFAGEYGTSIPIYFQIIKLHLVILLLLMLIFGIYYCYLSNKYCEEINNSENQTYTDNCSFMLTTHYFMFYNFYQQKIANSTQDQNIYYILGYIAYLIMMLTPLMHEILLKVDQVKYWKFDSLNHIRIPKLTLYIKHIPKKFTEQEIQLYIQNAIQSKYKQLSNNNFIEEIVYIYDIHPIKELNEQRKNTYLQALQLVEQIKNDPKLESKGQLIDLVIQLLHETRKIQQSLTRGLPFTQKVILKFNSESVTNLVYKYYDKNFFNRFVQQFTTIKEEYQNYEEYKKNQKFELQAQLLNSQTSSSSRTSSVVLAQSGDLQEVARTQSEINRESVILKSSEIVKDAVEHNINKQSMIEFLNLEEENENNNGYRNSQSQIDQQKGLHLQRGFRQDDIFWENIGMHTMKRLYLRLTTTFTTLFVSLLIMALFEAIFLMEKGLKAKGESILMTIVVIVMTLFTIVLSAGSTILVISLTKKSKRSTYSLQEKNMITFMSPIQQVCILAFPFIFVLSFLQRFNALNNLTVLQSVSKLAQTRLIAKGLLHIFHLRKLSFDSRVKKIKKNFNPMLYFQKQLNQLMQPPYFPIRSRLFYILFIYSTGMMTIFLNPFLLIWCIVLLLIMLIYDRYSVINVYQYDKLFTFQLLKYLILTYQFIMLPIYCYMYIITFTNISLHINDDSEFKNFPHISILWTYLGYGTFLLAFISFVFFRKPIANFWVFYVMRYTRPCRDSTIFNEKSYFQSYTEYFDDLGVQELNTLLIDTFQHMQYKTK